MHRARLTNHLRGKAGFQLVQAHTLRLPYPLGGHAAGLAHHLGNFRRGQHRHFAAWQHGLLPA